jgi:hypothetical protein
MITNFEEETSPLTAKEKNMLPLLMELLKNVKKEKPILSQDLCNKFNLANQDKSCNHLNGVRLRKLTNHIRSSGGLPIIATSKGYYCSYDNEDIRLQIKSLNERADAIMNSAKGLEQFLKTPMEFFGFKIFI